MMDEGLEGAYKSNNRLVGALGSSLRGALHSDAGIHGRYPGVSTNWTGELRCAYQYRQSFETGFMCALR